jgi:murein DD-endopeptidase MepM/ murein hydrolase activator NlpD
MSNIQTDSKKTNKKPKKTTIVLVAILWAFTALSFVLHTNRQKQAEEERAMLQLQFEQLNKEMAKAEATLAKIQAHDESIYRKILEAKPISKTIRLAGFGGADYYKKYRSSLNSEKLISTAKRIDILSKQMHVQSKSFNELVKLAKEREEKMKHIPSLLPVNERDIEKFAAPYGMRIHPILGYKRMHYGVDIVAERGADIYASGKGTIILAGYNRGFGKCVKIDHGYGYISVYAHMSKITVKKGQEVTRGDLIGLVGNTGLSTGPHLHYEVRINNKAVDPSIFY